MLPARFHALRDRAVAAVDRTYAEPVKIVFKAGGGRDLEAVLRTSDQDGPDRGGRSQSWNAEMVGVAGILHVDRATYPDLQLVKGDRVRALARPGEPWFEVARADPRQTARLRVYLTQG